MWIYPVLFLSTMVADSVPIFLPSAWVVMVVFFMKFKLPFLPVLCTGVCGSAVARYFHGLYLPKVADSVLLRAKQADLELFGKKLMQKGWRRYCFVFFYTLTPLPATVLFAAAGIAKIKPRQILIPFFVGRFIGYGILMLAIQTAVGGIRRFRHGATSWIALLTGVFGFMVMFAVLFIDWRALLERSRFRLRFKIWK